MSIQKSKQGSDSANKVVVPLSQEDRDLLLDTYKRKQEAELLYFSVSRVITEKIMAQQLVAGVKIVSGEVQLDPKACVVIMQVKV